VRRYVPKQILAMAAPVQNSEDFTFPPLWKEGPTLLAENQRQCARAGAQTDPAPSPHATPDRRHARPRVQAPLPKTIPQHLPHVDLPPPTSSLQRGCAAAPLRQNSFVSKSHKVPRTFPLNHVRAAPVCEVGTARRRDSTSCSPRVGKSCAVSGQVKEGGAGGFPTTPLSSLVLTSHLPSYL